MKHLNKKTIPCDRIMQFSPEKNVKESPMKTGNASGKFSRICKCDRFQHASGQPESVQEYNAQDYDRHQSSREEPSLLASRSVKNRASDTQSPALKIQL